ncbi:MAG: redoxin domain-containing protein, partial [Anaerolineales bacterium]
MVALTAPAPSFSLPDLTGRIHKLEAYRGQLVLLYFWSAVCPWSERADREIAKWPSSLASAAVILRLAMNADEGVDLVRGEAAKRFGVHRNTITKMLSFSVPPGYRRRERPASKKLGPYLAWIDAILEGDSQVHKKQRHTAHR